MEHLDFPPDWDQLSERKDPAPEAMGEVYSEAPAAPEKGMTTALFAAAWADLVCITAVCTAALLALIGLGYQTTLPAFPWAAAVGVLWWSMACAATLMIRRGSPGMLMAGVLFDETLKPGRLPAVVAAALLLSATLGLGCLLGPKRSLLRLASGLGLTTADQLSV